MASSRRSSRGGANLKNNYCEFDSDDKEGKLACFYDSESDFEDDLKKKADQIDFSFSSNSSLEDKLAIEKIMKVPMNTCILLL